MLRWEFIKERFKERKQDLDQEKRKKSRSRPRKKASFKILIFFFHKFPPLDWTSRSDRGAGTIKVQTEPRTLLKKMLRERERERAREIEIDR